MFELSFGSVLLGGIAGYLFGSIPCAYLITRRFTGRDLRLEGSGNIGTLNAYEVTSRKSVGILTLCADLLKALIPICLFEYLGWPGAVLTALPGLAIGHCYPVWLRFHGGRGLAVVFAGTLPVAPLILTIWIATYFIALLIRKHVHFGATVASVLSLLAVGFCPPRMISWLTLEQSGLKPYPELLSLAIAMCLIVILSRHAAPFRELMRQGRIP